MREAVRKTGRCSTCGVYKALTSSGYIKQHRRHQVPCAGSLSPPIPVASTNHVTWSSARKATIDRDDRRCRKCQASTDLEVHHIKERSCGGSNELENLITLCSPCHLEWTYAEPSVEVMTFDVWLTVPPARYLIGVWIHAWPSDKSAAAFKHAIAETIQLVTAGRR